MTAPKTTEDKTTVAKPVVAKSVGKKTEVSEAVVVNTASFDVSQPKLIEDAKDLFLAMVKNTYGDVPISDVRFIKVNHRVGISAEYHFTATLGE